MVSADLVQVHHMVTYLEVPITGCNMKCSDPHGAMEGSQAPLHVHGIPRQQQLVQDAMVPMPGCQVAGGHSLVVVSGYVAPCNDQFGHHLQMPTFSRMMQGCSKQHLLHCMM